MRTQVENELATEHEMLSGGLQRGIEIDVIEPKCTRTALAAAIAAAPCRRGDHENIPL